ncbi:4Fe-4S dicluster domain-containing protein [Desulfurispirillum indicum]|uniref:glutamate synthase (NADPH) n=1 Tax=Desulfurispirillum indicum (strain ATCC BAA-1389 / DSM 22839 / S5) TaxID=653733 RepID=E6W1X5_DESIS|nr:glutamate synthase-related protein [Desulfurispirillum indicum]ADU65507.1 ferredoxin-dependent glutamate synthase [Desulfurispirillum indicum S5]UCZ57426.1 4Fe-4S dicluster domain-containing protein [Desulfurispirillum indicum]
MATMRVNAIARDDLFWRINYKHDRCTMCGKCLASCPFRAIEAGVEKRRRVISDHLTPKPKVLFQTVPVIRQVLNHHEACRGCGICEKVCPNEAIAPYFNKDNRLAIKYRSATADAYKRGGRSNLNPMGSTLDKITVGRISQMTDPSLDAQRHTFDILAPLGRVLPPQSLPLSIKEGRLDITRPLPPLNWMYPIIIGDMSIGALSTRMWEALSIATAYLNEEAGIPIRMCTGEGGIPGRLLRSRYVRYMILQIASGHFGWNRIVNAMPRMQDDPAGVLIKIGQGAKPGDGGMLQAKKVARHIQEIRGVPKTDLLSPPNHQGLYSIEESVQKMFLSFNSAFQFRVPVAIKVAASATSVSVYNNLLRDPYNIVGGFFLDGISGGTGAAQDISLDHTGHPIVSKLRDCYLAAVHQGKQGQIPLWAGGGMGQGWNLAADAFKMICLGANGVFTGKLMLQLAGCVGLDNGKCNACNTGLCPVGICTQNPILEKRLDIDRVAEGIVNYFIATDQELKKLMAPIGNSSLPVGRSDALISTDTAVAEKLNIPYSC